MFELNSDYERFYNNICVLCDLIWNLLQTTEHGTPGFMRKSQRNFFPLTGSRMGKGSLNGMTVFAFSPYALLEKKTLKAVIFEGFYRNSPAVELLLFSFC